jgi:hypothetical protein
MPFEAALLPYGSALVPRGISDTCRLMQESATCRYVRLFRRVVPVIVTGLGILKSTSIASGADVLAYWDFNNSTDSSGFGPDNYVLGSLNTTGTVEVYNPATGMLAPPSQGVFASGASLDLSDLVGTNGGPEMDTWGTFGGTTLNALGDDPAGNSLAIAGYTSNGTYITIDVPTTGHDDINVTYASWESTHGGTSETWQYSNDDVNFTTLTTYQETNDSTWYPAAIDFTSASSTLQNQPMIYLRSTIDGTSSTTGDDRYDNLQVTANQMVSWASAADGDWSNASSWSSASVPTASVDADFNTGSTMPYTVTLTGASSANNLNVQGDTVSVNLAGNTLNVSGTLSVTAANGQNGSLTLCGASSGTAAIVGGLAITTGGLVNVNTALLITSDGGSPATAEAAIQQYIESGEITTTVTGLYVAYADGSDAGLEDSNLQPGQIVIEPDYAGDTDLSGTVAFHDLQILLGNFGQPGFWDQGNFNGHATVDFNDLQLLLGNFNDTASLSYSELAGIENLVGEFGDVAVADSDGSGFSLVVVPEPAAISLLAIALTPALWRRTRRGRHGPADFS